MAQTVGFNDLDDENQNNQQNQVNTGQPTTTPGAGQQGTQTGGGAYTAGNTTNSGQSSGAPNKPVYNQQNQGTGFTNLQSYVNANNPSQLQQTVAQGIENQNQNVLNNLGQSQQQFQQGTAQNQANTNANQQLIQNVLSNPLAFTNVAGQSGATGQAVTAAGTPSNQQLTQGNLFSQLMGGQYQGPTGLANQTQLVGQAQGSQQQAQNLTTAGGRQAILQQILGASGYNTGEQQLDAALLGQGQSPALNTAATQAQALNQIVAQAGAGAQAQGAEQANAAQQFGQQTQGQFTQNVQNLNSQLQQQAATAQAGQNAAYQQLVQAAQSGNLNAQQASLLGLTQGEQVTQDTLNQIQNYITQNPMQATAQNVASGQNYATLAALQQLAGSNTPAAAQQVLGQYQGQQGAAGTFQAQPQANVNQQALNAQIQSTTGAYQNAQNQAAGQLAWGQNYNRWASGQLTDKDISLAQQWGVNPSLISAAQAEMNGQGGNGFAAQQLGQALWQANSQQWYGHGSPQLTSSWASGDLQAAQQNQQNVQNQLQQEYGGLDTINVANQGNPTQNALQTMAQGLGPQIIPGT